MAASQEYDMTKPRRLNGHERYVLAAVAAMMDHDLPREPGTVEDFETALRLVKAFRARRDADEDAARKAARWPGIDEISCT
jgi:hypothetical protein